MRTSTVLIAVAVAVASALLAWATMPSRPGVTPRNQPAETFALAFDIPSVESITVTSAGETATLTRDGLDWTLTLPTTANSETPTTTWPANPDAVRVLINELATQSIESANRSNKDANTEPAADPLATITIDLPAGPTTIAVTAAPIGGRLPIRITDASGTRPGFVAANRFRPTDVGQLAALADPKPFNTAGVISRVALTPRDGEGFAIHRVGGIWQAESDDPTKPSPRLHQPTIRTMLDDLAAIRAASVIVPAEIPAVRQPPDQSIDDPFLTIETTADLPRSAGEPARRMSASLVIDDQATIDGLTNAIATRSTGEQRHVLQVRLDPQAFPALPADQNSLLDPTPMPFRPSEATAFRLSSPQTEIDLRRTIDGWTADGELLTPTQSDALGYVLLTLSQPATRVYRVDPERKFVGPTVQIWSLTATDPITLSLYPWVGDLPFEVSDGRALWEIDEVGKRFDEAIADLPRAASSP